MLEEKSTIYAIIAACIMGIFIVGFFVITYVPITVGFSEVYFEESEKLPRVISSGKVEEFDFTFASHEKDEKSYRYTVKIDDEIIGEGGFTVPPDENITVNATFISKKSSLVFVRNLSTTESSHLIASGTSSSTGLVPIEVPIVNSVDSDMIVLNLDPKSEESYSFESDKKEPFGDFLIRRDKEESLEPRLSDAGINFINYNTTVKNNAGNIQITYKKEISEYRYEFKNVSVAVTSEDGIEYGLHFWAIVV